MPDKKEKKSKEADKKETKSKDGDKKETKSKDGDKKETKIKDGDKKETKSKDAEKKEPKSKDGDKTETKSKEADENETKKNEESLNPVADAFLTSVVSTGKYEEDYAKRSSSLHSDDSGNENLPWYRAIIPTKVRALFKKATVSIQNAESWAEYQDDPDWSFPMVKAHVYLLDKSGAPSWFPIGPALKFLNQQTAVGAVRQFSTYSMERIHHYAMNGESLHSLYASRKLVDVLIHINDRSFYAHRCVLCTHSEFFATILLENDIPPYAVTDITLKHIDQEIFKRFLHFIYTGDVFVNLSNLYALRRLANILKAKSLKAKLMIFMAQTGAMNLEEAIKILVDDTDEDAMPMAVEVVKSNFKSVIEDDRFQRFSFENFLEIISGDNLCVNTELDVFWAVLFWVAYDYANRINYFPQLLSEVRFTCMTSLELMDCAKVTDMIKLSEKCKRLLITANWVCHAREIGLEDPLSLPEHPQRQCLIDTPHIAPTVEEFDKRFLKYMTLMNREIGTVTKQSENTKRNAKRVYFAPDDDDDYKGDMHKHGEEDISEMEGRLMADNVKRRRSSSLKEVYIRNEPQSDEDEGRGGDGETTPAKPQNEFRSKHFKETEKGKKTPASPSATSSDGGKDGKSKKKKKKKKSKPGDGGKINSSIRSSSDSDDSSSSDQEKGEGKKKKPKKGGKKGKHDKSKHKGELEQGDSVGKGNFLLDIFRKKAASPQGSDLTPQPGEEQLGRTPSVSSLGSTESQEVPGMPLSKREKKKKEKHGKKKKKDKGKDKDKKKDKDKDKDKGKEGEGKKKRKKHKKKKDKNQQNNPGSTSESESLAESNSSLSISEPELDGEGNVTLNKSQDSRDVGDHDEEMRLLGLSDSCTLEPDHKPPVDALSLWESSVNPVQENGILSGSILLPVPRQKVVLTKMRGDAQIERTNLEVEEKCQEQVETNEHHVISLDINNCSSWNHHHLKLVPNSISM